MPSFNPLPSHEGRQKNQWIYQIYASFNPLPSHEGRLLLLRIRPLWAVFQSTSLSRGKTSETLSLYACFLSFNPLPSHEGRLSAASSRMRPDAFNPLPSHEGRQYVEKLEKKLQFFQSTSLSRGKTLWGVDVLLLESLSIHFPLTREDPSAHYSRERLRPFNPLPSHEGRHKQKTNLPVFLSFNPLPSHEGRLISGSMTSISASFNPLPSHEGRRGLEVGFNNSKIFQSTSLSRGKTAKSANFLF